MSDSLPDQSLPIQDRCPLSFKKTETPPQVWSQTEYVAAVHAGWKFSKQGSQTGFYAHGNEWCVYRMKADGAELLAHGFLRDSLNWVNDIRRQLFDRNIVLPR